MTKILICKPHHSGREDRGIQGSAQKSGENIAAVINAIPDQVTLYKQHDALEHVLKSIIGDNLYKIDFPDSTYNSVSRLFNGINNKQYDLVCSMIDMSLEEIQEELVNNALRNGENIGSNKRPETIEDFFNLYKHGTVENPRFKDSFIFIRDSFVSNQTDKILLSSFRATWRRFETKIIKEILETLQHERDVVENQEKGVFFEGGDFRYIPGDGILFAGFNPDNSSRNNREGIEFVKKEFQIRNDNLLTIQGKNAFHIDTFFSVVTNEEGNLIAGIICENIVENLKEVEEFFKKKKVPLYVVPSAYGIGVIKDGIKKVGQGTSNTLQIGNHLLSSGFFTDDIEQELEASGVKRVITPTSEFWKAGGGIHCLTNQL